MFNKFYITATLPYANGNPHLGHALEFIQADVISRYKRSISSKDNVFFNLGVDEHGLKIYLKAKELGLEPIELVNKNTQIFKDFCSLLNISYDNFYRTSSDFHKENAKKFWNISFKNGDIYKKKYKGLYCVGCESFVFENDLVDGKCPLHNKKPILIEEENWFLKLSKYRKALSDFLSSGNNIKPDFKSNELYNFNSQISDISISRSVENLPWGVEVPNDSSQVMYVWFDALTNYLSALKFNNKSYEEWWNNENCETIQIFGPDNLRFQGGIFQGMLKSFNFDFTKKLLCHGTILDNNGNKMSKSIGNVVDPIEQINKYNLDAFRYYLIVGMSTFADSPYKESTLVDLYNSHLANNFGNLLNRVIHLANKNEVSYFLDENKIEKDFNNNFIKEPFEQFNKYIEEYELQKAFLKINEVNSLANEYITEKAPWKMENKDEIENILNNLSILLYKVSSILEILIPNSAKIAKDMLTKKEKGILFEKL
ncbi:methionine--tRNA ligase [Patescibacteria group bacterium]|nr:methionine--tRNA ligase [Patescibacteria group bacterium]